MLPLSGVCSLFIGGCDPVRSNKFRGIYGLIYSTLRGLFFLRWMLPHSGVCNLYAGGCGPVRYCSCKRWLKHLWVISRKGLLTSDVVFLYNFNFMTEISISEQKSNICSIINVSCFLLFSLSLKWINTVYL